MNMKTKPYRRRLILVTACFAMTMPPAMAQTVSAISTLAMDYPLTEAPKTATEKLADLQTRYTKAISDLTANLNRLPSEPGLLGSKALFSMVDESIREMKNIRSGCTVLMSSLRTESKTVAASSSFSEEQKQELSNAAEDLAKECTTLSKKLDLAIGRLGAAYTIFPKWNRMHKSYRNLQGDGKASGVIKAQVEEYLNSFTPEPEPSGDTARQEEGESTDAFP